MRPNTPGFFFEMKGIIYKATNTLNGKVYIGQTVGSLANRRGEHQRDAVGDTANHFHTALYQYPDLFEWEVIDTFHGTREEIFHALNVAEEYNILKYNSTDERFGYNATAGGYSSDKFAEHIKRRAQALGGRARAVLQYDANGNFVREFESINAVCAYLGKPKMHGKVLFGDGLHYGYQWREKTSNFFPQKIEPYKKPIKCGGVAVLVYREDGAFFGRYETRANAFRAVGASGAVREMDGKPIFLHHHQLRDFYFFKEVPNPPERVEIIEIKKEVKESKPCGVRVAAYTIDGTFIREYDSMSEAARECRASVVRIGQICKMPLPIVLHPNSTRTILWRYSDGNPKPKIEVIDHRAKKVEKMVWRLQPDGTKIRVPVVVTESKANEYKKIMEHRVIQYSLEGEFIKVWESAYVAGLTSGETASYIGHSLKGDQRAKAKFIWRHYAEDYPRRIDTTWVSSAVERESEPIVQLNRAGEVIARYADRKEAARATGVSISHVCNIVAGKVRHPSVRLLRESDYKRRYEGQNKGL